MTVVIQPLLTYRINVARAEFGVRAGLIGGRYLHDFELARAVAEDAYATWLAAPEDGTVEQSWDAYVDRVEAAVGGFDRCAEEVLEQTWLVHASGLLARRATVLCGLSGVDGGDRWGGGGVTAAGRSGPRAAALSGGSRRLPGSAAPRSSRRGS